MPNKNKETAKGFRSSTAKSRAKKLYKNYETSAMGKLNPGNAIGKAVMKSKKNKYSDGGIIQHD